MFSSDSFELRLLMCWIFTIKVCVFVLLLYYPVNSYGHGETASSPNKTFSWANLNKWLTSNGCTYFRLWLTTTLLEWISRREENDRKKKKSRSISTKVWDRARTELETPESAVKRASVVRHISNFATRSGQVYQSLWAQLLWYKLANFHPTLQEWSMTGLVLHITRMFCYTNFFLSFTKDRFPYYRVSTEI